MSRLSSSERVAQVLRENPPHPDDLARARLEKRLVQAALAPRPVRRSPRVVVAASAGVALAAAVLLAVVLISHDADEGTAPIAQFERRGAATSLERGTLEEGSTLRTGEDEVAEIRVAGSWARIGGASRARIVRLSHDELTLELEEGSVDVTYHPREPGRERMTLETPNARVEVVGTVFHVSARPDATEVSVSEGTVRVVPRSGPATTRLVHAGESTRIVRDAQSAAEPETNSERPGEPGEHAGVEAIPGVSQEEAPGEEPPHGPEQQPELNPAPAEAPADAAERAAPTPAERLEHARQLIEQGRAPAARRVLDALRRSSASVEVRAEAWMLIADVDLRGDRLEAAAQAYANAEREGRGTPGGAIAIFSLARLQHRRLGDRDAARVSYERYLAAAPNGALSSQAKHALCSLGADEHCEAP